MDTLSREATPVRIDFAPTTLGSKFSPFSVGPFWLAPVSSDNILSYSPVDNPLKHSQKYGNILSWRLIMKYFLRSFSPFRWFKKGSCQFLECAQYWLTA